VTNAPPPAASAAPALAHVAHVAHVAHAPLWALWLNLLSFELNGSMVILPDEVAP
jgi:hypothetical protein